MAATPSEPAGWFDRLRAMTLRWGTLIAVAVGALTLFSGLGKNGLWEPWEMDRADLARTLSNPPEAVVALGASSSDAELQAIQTAANEAGVALKRPDIAPISALRSALDFARLRVVSAIVIDTELLLPDATRDDLWRQAGKLVGEAARYAAGGQVVLLRRPQAPAAQALLERLALERARDVWDTAATDFGLSAVWSTDNIEPALAELAADFANDLVVVEAAQPAALASPLADGASAVSLRVAFKDKGELKVVPPLESWLRAATYQSFGATELTTRLPGVVLALLALWVLVITARTVWGPRVALASGLVLATMPLFFGQARIISGEPSLILAVTLVACGFLLFSVMRPDDGAGKPDTAAASIKPSLPWAYLLVGLVVGALGKGAFALALLSLIALAIPLTRGSRRLADWAPAAVFLGATALVQLVATSAGPGSFLAGLDYRADTFTEGYALYSKTFDIVIRDLGFGMAPWSPLVVVSIGLLTYNALSGKDPRGLVVAAWFFLPVVAAMAGIKTGDHFLFCGVGAAAISVGLFVDRMLARPHELAPGTETAPPRYFIAFAIILMFYIIRRELKPSPEPMVAFLAFDPPFAREGNLRFPETVPFDSTYKFLFILVALAVFFHFGRIASMALSVQRWLRRPAPFFITTGVVLLLTTLVNLITSGRIHGMAMGSAYADNIQASSRELPSRLAHFGDPMILIAVVSSLGVLAVVALRWMYPHAGRALASALNPLAQRSSRILLYVFLGAWAAALVTVAATVSLPSGYIGELALSSTGVFAVLGAVIVGLLVRGVGSTIEAVLVGFGVLLLLVTTQLQRDASLSLTLVSVLIPLGLIALAAAFLPRLLRRIELFFFAFCTTLTLIGLHYVAILIDRGYDVAEVVYATEIAKGTMTASQAARPMTIILIPVVLLGLVGNWAMPRIVAWFARTPERTASTNRWLERTAETLVNVIQHRFVAVSAMFLLAAVGTLSFLLRLEPAIAVNVSQKHILDEWFGDSTHGPETMYKHGSFASGQGRKDSNFYTADVPEVRDRQAALRVLLGREDQVLEVETPRGTETRYIPGFSPLNDKNGDKQRDAAAITGFATAATQTTLTDTSANWTPNALTGKVLADASGRTWQIVSNDKTSVSVAATDRLTFATTPRSRAFYVIDERGLDVRSTAQAPTRRAVLLPADQLSELNYAWRQLSGGTHLPVLDGSSYRVLLTTSWLENDEPQQNRLALATYTDQSFAELAAKDERIKRVWGTFDDTLQLVGYSTDKDTVGTGSKLKLTLYFKTLKLVKKSLKLFIHMDKTGGGSRIQGDHWPLNPTRHTEDNKNCTGCYRTDHWLVGDIVADSYDIEIPEGNTGEYMIWIGLYQPGPDTRAAVRDWDKKNARHDGSNRLGIGTFRVK